MRAPSPHRGEGWGEGVRNRRWWVPPHPARKARRPLPDGERWSQRCGRASTCAEIRLGQSGAMPTQQSSAISALDPVTVEVIRRRLVAIADEVDVNITRTAFSPYIYEYKDYAVGIVDASGDLICQCTAAMPVFVADVMRASVLDGLQLYGPENLHPGDIIVTNYAGTV